MPDNVITRMFTWWNQAYLDHGFNPTGFAQFFTDDAPFVVDGGVRGTGPAEISAHFQRIRAGTEAVELVMPVQATLSDGETAFVRYQTTFRSADKVGAEECLAVAQLRNGKIAAFEVIGRSS